MPFLFRAGSNYGMIQSLYLKAIRFYTSTESGRANRTDLKTKVMSDPQTQICDCRQGDTKC